MSVFEHEGFSNSRGSESKISYADLFNYSLNQKVKNHQAMGRA